MAGWVDFDGTLSSMVDGSPIEKVVAKLKEFDAQGVEIRICTARVATKYPKEHIEGHTRFIQQWCLHHIGKAFPVTSEKDYDMVVLFDDRAIAVQTNTGELKGWLDIVEA